MFPSSWQKWKVFFVYHYVGWLWALMLWVIVREVVAGMENNYQNCLLTSISYSNSCLFKNQLINPQKERTRIGSLWYLQPLIFAWEHKQTWQKFYAQIVFNSEYFPSPFTALFLFISENRKAKKKNYYFAIREITHKSVWLDCDTVAH